MKKIAALKILIDTLIRKNRVSTLGRFNNPFEQIMGLYSALGNNKEAQNTYRTKFGRFKNPFEQIVDLYSALGNNEEAQKYEFLYAELRKDTTAFDYQFPLAQKDLLNNRFDDAQKRLFALTQKGNAQKIAQAFAENKSTHPDYGRMENLLKTTFLYYTNVYFRNKLLQLQDSLPHTYDSLQIYNHFIDTVNLFIKIDSFW